MKVKIFQKRICFESLMTPKQFRHSALVAAMSIALLLGPVWPVGAQVTSVNGKIAYVACGNSTHPFFSTQCDIWVMNPDGTGQTNVTNTSDLNEMNPSWSLDGTKIAYIDGCNGVNYLKVIDLGFDVTGRAVTTINCGVSWDNEIG